MISKFQTLVSSSGVKDAQVQNTSNKINELDRIHLLDRGSQLTLEAGIVYKCLILLANSRNLTPEAYIAEFKKLLEEQHEEPNNPQ